MGRALDKHPFGTYNQVFKEARDPVILKMEERTAWI